jgi:Domain of unknown function (DUF4062)
MKAFISSTIVDLADYRETAQSVLKDLGVDYVTLDKLIAIDSLLENIGNRVRSELESCDVVVVIVGHRYGSIEPASGVGWVEAEFQAARRIGKPILAFLADEDAPFPAASVDKNRSQVDRFRTEVLSNYLVARFRSPTDLAAKLAVALTHLIRRFQESQPVRTAAPRKNPFAFFISC